jgi:hypothetical protein
MAMDGARLGEEMAAAVLRAAQELAETEDEQEFRLAVYRALGTAIVRHIQRNAEIEGLRVVGVRPGQATSGPNIDGRIR